MVVCLILKVLVFDRAMRLSFASLSCVRFQKTFIATVMTALRLIFLEFVQRYRRANSLYVCMHGCVLNLQVLVFDGV